MSYVGPALAGDIAFEKQHGGARRLLGPDDSLTTAQQGRTAEDEVEAYLAYRAEQDALDAIQEQHDSQQDLPLPGQPSSRAGTPSSEVVSVGPSAGIGAPGSSLTMRQQHRQDRVPDYSSGAAATHPRSRPTSAGTSAPSAAAAVKLSEVLGKPPMAVVPPPVAFPKHAAPLGRDAKAALLAHVMGSGDMDIMQLMAKFQERLDAVGMQMPAVEVRFSNITATRRVAVGNRAMPTLPNALIGMGEALLSPFLKLAGAKADNTHTIHMLQGVSGVLKPGRLTLLLGPPGAGKSTLLKVLSGQMKDKAIKVEGEVTYNGLHANEFVVEHTAAYIDQMDRHIAEMTVRETMAFSAKMMGQGAGNEPMYPIVTAKEKELGITPDPKVDELIHHWINNPHGPNIMVDIMARLLGLDGCADTVVGNDLLKGISGGQKKRVTTGEMVVGHMPCLFMDEISTGLDSASTLLITKALRNLCAVLRVNIIVALLQPTPETYEVFEDVMVMAEGRIVFHGPREQVLPHFQSLGFTRPPHKAEADYLQEVTSKFDQQKYLPAGAPPLRPAQLAAAYQASPLGQARAGELTAPLAATELDMTRLGRRKYLLSTWAMTWAVLKREALLMARNKLFIMARGFQNVFMAFMVCTTFPRLPKDDMGDANHYMSVAFFSLMNMLISGFAEVPFFVMRLPVFYKQRNYNFYPAWSYCLAGAITRIPDNLLMATLWSLVAYWSVGFTSTAGQFFIFLLVMASMTVWSTAIFRTLAAWVRNEVLALAAAAVVMMLVINTAGFTIAKNAIPDWWIWMYWISPLAWGMRAMLANEFNTNDWDQQVAPGMDQSLGLFALQMRAYQEQTWWVWAGVGALLGSSVALTALQAYLLTVTDPPAGDAGAAVGETEVEGAESAGAAKEVEMGKVTGSGDVEEGSAPRSTSLPFTPLTMSFTDIKYHVPKPKGRAGEELTLLNGVDGVFRPGVLTALMGASGAGKTTLMDVLAGRKTGGRVEGQVMVNGHPKKQSTFARVMGYVEQFDLHSPKATVLEALLFSGRLRLPESMGVAAVTKFVHEVMALVELTPLASSLVGTPGESGLSVEQRKRLTIAVELVANPSVIFMDEPTSGLDSRAASIVMQAVRNTVNTGRTVVCTIHQPSLEIFQAFDELLLLKRGGETIFFGPLGPSQANLIAHFQAIEGVPRFPEGQNPANWMLEVSTPGAEKAMGVDFAAIYKHSDMCKAANLLIDEAMRAAEGSRPLAFDSQYAVSYFTQFRLLLHKNLVMYWRTPSYNVIRYIITIFCGLVFGSLYWDIGMDRSTEVSLLNILGALYSSVLWIGVANTMTVMPIVNNERVVYYREKASGMYLPALHAIAQGMVEIPYLIGQTIIYSLMIYWMIGFEANVVKFFWFALFLQLNFMAFTFFGMLSVALTPSVQLSTVLFAFFFSAWNLFCGFLIAQPDIPGWWIWFYYFNPVTFSLYGLVVTQVGDVTDLVTLMSPDGSQVQVEVWKYVEDTFNYKHSMSGWVVLIMFGFILFFRASACIAQVKINWQKR